MIIDKRDLALLKLFETFAETAPQLTLQYYILWRNFGKGVAGKIQWKLKWTVLSHAIIELHVVHHGHYKFKYGSSNLNCFVLVVLFTALIRFVVTSTHFSPL